MKYLAIDQYGEQIFFQTKYPRKWLMDYFNSKKAIKMYQDKKDGTSYETGYVIKGKWLTVYQIYYLNEKKV